MSAFPRNWQRGVILAVAFIAGLTPAVTRGAAERADFVQRMARITEGTPVAEVRRLLGEPDDVRDETDPDDISRFGVKEIWAYGTDGPRTFPTLGRIFVAGDDTVKLIVGGTGSPPSPDFISEKDLRRLLGLIAAVPDSYEPADPLALIRAVNSLQPLGKEGALVVIEEFLRVTGDERFGRGQGLFFLLRTLFDVPTDPGYLPRPGLGLPQTGILDDRTLLPRFPITIEQDLPLSLIHGYILAGAPEPVEKHMVYFREHGQIRAHPLRPVDDPLALLAEFEASPRWSFREDSEPNKDHARTLISHQLLRLVESVYRPRPLEERAVWANEQFDATIWNRRVEEFGRIGARWDAATMNYVFSDGTTLPEKVLPSYRRQIWKLPQLGNGGSLVVLRISPTRVLVSLRHSENDGHVVKKSVVMLCRADMTRETLTTFQVKASSGGNSGHQQSRDIPLAAGERVVAILESEDGELFSPQLMP